MIYAYRTGAILPEGCDGYYVAVTTHNYSSELFGDAGLVMQSQTPLDMSRKKILDGAIVDMTAEECAIMDAKEAADAAEAKAARQAKKSAELKTAENAFLTEIATVNATFGFGIDADDSFQEAMAKIDGKEGVADIDKVKSGMKLRTLWDVVLYHGGRWGDCIYHD